MWSNFIFHAYYLRVLWRLPWLEELHITISQHVQLANMHTFKYNFPNHCVSKVWVGIKLHACSKAHWTLSWVLVKLCNWSLDLITLSLVHSLSFLSCYNFTGPMIVQRAATQSLFFGLSQFHLTCNCAKSSHAVTRSCDQRVVFHLTVALWHASKPCNYQSTKLTR